jgi:hypothetical protein
MLTAMAVSAGMLSASTGQQPRINSAGLTMIGASNAEPPRDPVQMPNDFLQQYMEENLTGAGRGDYLDLIPPPVEGRP